MMEKKKHGRFYKKYTIEKELKHHIIEWTATFLGILGAILNAKLIIDGFYASFYVWILANVFWVMFAVKHKHWGLLVLSIVYAVINVFAILKISGTV